MSFSSVSRSVHSPDYGLGSPRASSYTSSIKSDTSSGSDTHSRRLEHILAESRYSVESAAVQKQREKVQKERKERKSSEEDQEEDRGSDGEGDEEEYKDRRREVRRQIEAQRSMQRQAEAQLYHSALQREKEYERSQRIARFAASGLHSAMRSNLGTGTSTSTSTSTGTPHSVYQYPPSTSALGLAHPSTTSHRPSTATGKRPDIASSTSSSTHKSTTHDSKLKPELEPEPDDYGSDFDDEVDSTGEPSGEESSEYGTSADGDHVSDLSSVIGRLSVAPGPGSGSGPALGPAAISMSTSDSSGVGTGVGVGVSTGGVGTAGSTTGSYPSIEEWRSTMPDDLYWEPVRVLTTSDIADVSDESSIASSVDSNDQGPDSPRYILSRK
jgi:hypothetical protein